MAVENIKSTTVELFLKPWPEAIVVAPATAVMVPALKLTLVASRLSVSAVTPLPTSTVLLVGCVSAVEVAVPSALMI